MTSARRCYGHQSLLWGTGKTVVPIVQEIFDLFIFSHIAILTNSARVAAFVVKSLRTLISRIMDDWDDQDGRNHMQVVLALTCECVQTDRDTAVNCDTPSPPRVEFLLNKRGMTFNSYACP